MDVALQKNEISPYFSCSVFNKFNLENIKTFGVYNFYFVVAAT